MSANNPINIAGCLVTPICDGTLELGAEMFSGITDIEVEKCLKNIGLESGPVSGSLNAFLVKSGDKNILIDSGGGAMTPTTGNLLEGLRSSGITPEDIDIVLCTHLHPDHIGGLIESGSPVFKNAELKVHSAEPEFWQKPENRASAPEMFHGFFDLSNAIIEAYGDQLTTFDGETEVAPAINAVPLAGHTPGHCGFQIGDGDDGLLIWGDIVHVQGFQMPQPQASIAFDVDSELAVKTRIDMFERAVKNHLRIAGMHLSHPGLGHVVRLGEGFWFEPTST